jgi:hypothetical protein
MKRRAGNGTGQGAQPQGRRLPGPQPEDRDLPMRVRLGQRGREVEDEEILRDLRRAAKRLGKGGLGASEYRLHGGYSSTTVIRRFGSWNAAVERAGLEPPAHASDEELLADLRRVARRLRLERLGQSAYDREGRYSSQMMARHFGSWSKALERVALGTAGQPQADIEALLYNLLAVWLKLGRRPASAEMRRPLSKFSIRPYLHYFGTWRKAMAGFFTWLRERDPPGAADDGERPAESLSVERQVPPGTVLVRPGRQDLPPCRDGHKTSRKPTLRQRFRVMLRDHFRCRLCGRSPATNHGLELHIDHIKPWSGGGETVDENLQTLCSDCNHGKFDQ